VTLSIVIPSHSRADLLTACLHTVIAHAPRGTQIVVVDDGSKDEAVSRAASAFPMVEIIRHARPLGFCRATNTGIRAARGDAIELLNDDTEVEAGWAEAALAHFAQPNVGSVAPLVLQLEPDRRRSGLPARIDTAGDDYDRGGFARKRGHGQTWDEAPKLLHVAGHCWGVSAAAGFYRASALRELGGFRESFGAYFEDVELAHRLNRAGWSAIYEPASVVHHRVSSSYGRRPSRRTLERQSCNEERIFLQHTDGPIGTKVWLRHLAVLAGKTLRRIEEGTLAPWLAGRMRAVAEKAFRSEFTSGISG